MKRIKSILALRIGVGLDRHYFFGRGVAGGEHNTKAIVRSIHGKASVQARPAAIGWFCRVNQELSPGTELKTDADSQVYLQVNGFTSTSS